MGMAANTHRIFYDPAHLPHLEIRDVFDARNLSFDAHSHDVLELAILVQGRCTYVNRGRSSVIVPGTTTIMNPEDVHSCVPDNSAPLAFRLFYFDPLWVSGIQDDDGDRSGNFEPFACTHTMAAGVYQSLEMIFQTFSKPNVDVLEKECCAVEAIAGINRLLDKRADAAAGDHPRMARAAEYISDCCSSELKLDDVAREVGLSNGHLIRSFKRQFGMSPYSYLINRRIQVARGMIKQGASIVEAAYSTGFYDQSHFHKAFKRLTGVTPGDFVKALEPARSSG